MKLILSVIAVLISLEMNARQADGIPVKKENERSQTYELGYCSGKLFNGIGSGKSDFLKAAIRIPAETAVKFKGCRLTKLRVALDDEGFSSPKIFLSYAKEDKPFYSQNVVFTGNKTWDEITLETPYELEGKEFFIGYSLISRNGTMPMLTDDRPSESSGNWVALANVWYPMAEIQKVGNVSILGVLEGDNLPECDVSLEYIHFKPYVRPGEAFRINARIRNRATETIRRFHVSCLAGDAVPVDTVFDCVEIPYKEIYDFSFTAQAPGQGKHPVRVCIRIPDREDEELSNNEQTDSIRCRPDFLQRKIVVEHFATRHLPSTVEVLENLDEAVYARENINRVVHFAGYAPDEEFTLPQSEAYTWFYNQGKGYANGVMIDRNDLSGYKVIPGNVPFDSTSPVFIGVIEAWLWGEESKAFLGKMIGGELKEEPAQVRVDIAKSYDAGSRKLHVSVSARCLNVEGYEGPGDRLRLNVYLLEDHIRTDQQAPGGSVIYYVYDNVLRKVLSQTWGDEVTSGPDTFSKEYDCILPMKWDEKNVRILAFVSDYNPGDRLDCKIYNSETLAVTGKLASSISESPEPGIAVYSSGSEVTVRGEFSLVRIYDLVGNLVDQAGKERSVFRLPEGIYMVNVDNRLTRKVVVCE